MPAAFLKMFMEKEGGLLQPVPLLAHGSAYGEVEATRPGRQIAGFILIAIDRLHRYCKHAFDVHADPPAFAHDAVEWPAAFRIEASQTCVIEAFALVNPMGEWLIRGNSKDCFGIVPRLEAGQTLVFGRAQSVGLILH